MKVRSIRRRRDFYLFHVRGLVLVDAASDIGHVIFSSCIHVHAERWKLHVYVNK
jgi:hypothetical protein